MACSMRGELAHLLGAECPPEPLRFGIGAALAACFPQQSAQLGEGELRCGGRGRRGGQDGPGLGAHDPVAGAGERGQKAGEVLAQVGAELVVRGGPVLDGVLLGAGEDRDGLASSLSAGSGRCACMSVRRMLARTTASPWSDLWPATECRSRYRAVDIGLTG
jgi:hypothetical protein